MGRAFSALIDATGAAVRREPDQLVRALTCVPAHDLFARAARHRCAGLLMNAIAELRLRDPRIAEIRRMLQQYAGACAIDAGPLAKQIDSIVAALKRRNIPHILLKTAARIYAGESRAAWSQTFDIDVLVRNDDTQRAQGALFEIGYARTLDDAAVEAYRRHHHHLAPLAHVNGGKPLELHVRLATPGCCTVGTAWDDIVSHTEPVCGDAGTTLRLDAFGRGLHMMVHGAGLYRLLDAALLASDALQHPGLLSALSEVADSDGVQPVAFYAVVAMAARIAGVRFDLQPAVERYIEWIAVREELPAAIRDRMQFIDAWFANGGRLRGPATHLAVPRDVRSIRRALCYRELAGRMIVGAAASAYCLRRR